MMGEGGICVIGAGAVGTAVAARLSLAGEPVHVVARGRRLEQVRMDGLRVQPTHGPAIEARVAASDGSGLGVQSVVFVAVKGHAMAGVLPTLAPLVGPETMVVPLVNGIPWWYRGEGEGYPPRRCVVASVVYITAAMQQDGAVTTMSERLVLGEAMRQPPLARTIGLADRLVRAGIAVDLVDDIAPSMWTKVAFNLATNPLSVVSGATVIEQFTDPRLLPIVRNVIAEVRELAASEGEDLSLAEDAMIRVGRQAGAIRTSMLQDYEAGRPLEWSTIIGACLDLARERGVAMPVSRMIGELAGHRAASIA